MHRSFIYLLKLLGLLSVVKLLFCQIEIKYEVTNKAILHCGCPVYTRSDNGSEFTASRVKRFLKDLGVDTLFVEPGSPWENGYVESFNSRMRDELLDGELFLHIDEMKYVVERWRMDYNHYRPHSSLCYMTPAGFAELCRQAGCIRPHTPVLDGVQDCGILS